MAERPLYGGAMTVAHVPEDYMDTEAIMDMAKRPVPDNQEMFTAPGLGDAARANAPTTVFVDLLEVSDDARDLHEDPARLVAFHAAEILSNGSDVVVDLSASSASATRLDVPGAVDRRDGATTPAVAAYCSYLDVADLDVAVVRLPTVGTDVVLSMSGQREGGAAPSLSAIARSLVVHDWGLFG